MKKRPELRGAVALLACTASLTGTALVAAPSAVAASEPGTPCANKVITIPVGGKPYHLPVKAVTVEGGVSCAEAYKLIGATLKGELPSGWKSGLGKFEAPEGLIPSELKKGSKTIRYAVRGG